jgi:hypothetical protein
MSQHNIIGSEAFDRRPSVYIRSLRPGPFHRRRARTAIAFMAGAGVAVLGLAGGALMIFGPGLGG